MTSKSYQERWDIYNSLRTNKPVTGKSGQANIFIWDRQLETGIPEIDQQHRKLVQLINVLGRMKSAELENESFVESMLRIFDELSAYVDYHFRFEEELMDHYLGDNEHRDEHRHAHAEFTREINEARASSHDRPTEAAERALTFLSKWLLTHFAGTDMRMAKKILAIRSGAAKEQAAQQTSNFKSKAPEALNRIQEKSYEQKPRLMRHLLDAAHSEEREIKISWHGETELNKFSRAVEHSPVSIIITNAKGEFEYTNPKFTQLTGYSFADLIGKTPRVLKSGEMPTATYENLWATISDGQEWHGELRNRKKNGELFWDYVAISPLFSAKGKITHYVSIQENITERKLAEETLRHQKQLSDDIINSLPGIFYMLDKQGRFVRVNPEFLKVTGYSKTELEHSTGPDFFEGNDRSLIARKMREVFDKGDSWAEAELISKSGRKIPYYFTGHRTVIDDQPCLIGIGTDITERRALEQELAHQARTDSLTGLFNRRHFLELAEQELARARRYEKHLSGMMLDLDEFKTINDMHGHQTGDKVIRKVGEICRKTLREVDIVGRFGGEEFAIILPESDAKQAAEVAERLRHDIANSVIHLENGVELNFTASIGITTLTAADSDIDNMLNLADKALYEAKRLGRNKVCVARH